MPEKRFECPKIEIRPSPSWSEFSRRIDRMLKWLAG